MSDEWGDDEDPRDDDGSQLDGLPDFSGFSDVFQESDDVEDWPTERKPDLERGGAAESTVQTLLVNASDPSDSVSATALMGGRIVRIELTPQVTKMSEADLAREIVSVCRLTSRQAEAAQHHLIASLMSGLGHNPANIRAFLEHTVGLPSPETVRNEKVRELAAYYSNHD
jgi:hypothetical protein